MEAMGTFRVVRPQTIEDAVSAYEAGARYLAGGTDLLVNLRRGIETPTALIDLSAVDGMRRLEVSDKGLTLGGGVSLADIASNRHIQKEYAAIATAASLVAAATHREVATLGGNLCLDTRCVYYNQSEWWRNANAYCLKHNGETCHVAPSGQTCFAAFSGDVAPALLVYGAEVDIVGPAGARTVPLDDVYQDDGKAHLRLAAGELIVAVHVPHHEGLRSAYDKIRIRDAIDFPLVGAAVALRRDGDQVSDLAVALTGTNAMPLRVQGTADMEGRSLNVDALVGLLPKQIQPMTTTSVAPGYRRKVIANLVGALATGLYEA